MAPNRALYEAILRILADVDPVGILAAVNAFDPEVINADEYSPEARDLAARVESVGTLTQTDVEHVFEAWFGQPIAPDKAETIATRINGSGAAQKHSGANN